MFPVEPYKRYHVAKFAVDNPLRIIINANYDTIKLDFAKISKTFSWRLQVKIFKNNLNIYVSLILLQSLSCINNPIWQQTLCNFQEDEENICDNVKLVRQKVHMNNMPSKWKL